ncbi:hypothetical protein FRB94_014502 [Tulasnella sp. JGI-2019a]|nr:hypothetical protein FRB94_014502 [Tulasnella sp. JGI-2019a]KAG9011658.1 hypothetical protein FRB93_002719 [Tulasnella sp. JGI-2019a]KAG9038773.1 hypothetical protein FRB95_014322 [Tulasnella sp. JGI-2019a]
MPSSKVALFAAGSNAHGQLGNGTLDDSNVFNQCLFSISDSIGGGVLIPDLVAMTLDHSKLTVTSSPKVNLDRKLFKPTLPHAAFHSPDYNTNIIKVASGSNHTILLLGHHISNHDSYYDSKTSPTFNVVYGSGDSSKGQLHPRQGSTNASQSTRFERIHLAHEAQGYHVVDIATAWETSYFVLRHLLHPDQNPDLLITIGCNDFGERARAQSPVPSDARSDGGGSRKGKGKASNGTVGMMHEHIVSFDHLLRAPDDTLPFHISSITASVHHAIAILESPPALPPRQIITGWGACRHGQLGPQVAPPPCPLRDGAKTTPPLTFISTPTQLLSVSNDPVRHVGTGVQHTVLIHESGTITAWGSNRKHQLQGVSSESDVTDVECTWNGTYLISTSGSSSWSVLATGSGEKGQLGRANSTGSAEGSSSLSRGSSSGARPSTPSILVDPILAPVNFPFDQIRLTKRVIKLSCGSEHVLALLQDTNGQTELWGWGWNEHGNLGQGHERDIHQPTLLDMPGSLKAGMGARVSHRIVNTWAGCGTSWIAVEIDKDSLQTLT